MPFANSSTPHRLRVSCAARFAPAAVAFRGALKTAAAQYMAEGSAFGVSADHCYGLPGADAEVRRALDGTRDRFPADRFDLQHHFAWSEDGLDHLIEPITRR